jgi:glucosamine kinase
MIALGIDVGGTASRWVAVDGEGETIARGAARGGTGHLFNPEQRAIFIALLGEIITGLDGRRVDAIRAGITGFGEDVASEATSILAEIFGAPTAGILCTDDMDLAFRAAFAPGEGHMLSVGTGSIGLHIAADGTVIRVGGRGLLIDDGGSGVWIALNALDRIYRRIDETGGPADAAILAEHLYAAIGGDDWGSVRHFIYGSDRGRIGTLARIVANAASAGDPVALKLMAEAGEEIARLGRALIGRGGDLPVAIVGGIAGLHPVLRDAIAAGLPRPPTYPVIDAALAAAQLALAGNRERT